MVFDLPNIKLVKSYVEDLKTVLVSATIIEQRAFLKSFVKDIQVGTDLVTIHYTLPMSPKNSEEESIGVLPFIQQSRPCRSRTCDTLIKSPTLVVPSSAFTYELELLCQ
jgi:hypothetical protein